LDLGEGEKNKEIQKMDNDKMKHFLKSKNERNALFAVKTSRRWPDVQSSEWSLVFSGLVEPADTHKLVLADGNGVGDEANFLQTIDYFLEQMFDFGLGSMRWNFLLMDVIYECP